MKKLRQSDYTFQKTTNLFGEDVVMVLRNKDKKHIISLTAEHRIKMIEKNLNPDDNEHIFVYLDNYSHL